MDETGQHAVPSLSKNAFVLLVIQVLALAASFVVSVVLARTLGPEGKGTLSLLQLVAGLLYMTASLGIPSATVYVAARGGSDPRLVTGHALKLALVSQATVFAAFLVALPWIRDSLLRGVDTRLLLAAASVTMVSTVSGVLGARLLSVGRPLTSSVPSLAGQLGFAIALLGIAAFGTVSLAAAVLTWAAISWVTVGVIWYRSRDLIMSTGYRGSEANTTRKALLGYGWKAWLSGAMTFLNYRQDLLIVSWLLGPAAVGVYSVGVTFAELVWHIPNAVSSVLFPKVARLDVEEAGRLTGSALRVVILLTAFVAVGILAIGPLLIPLIFGQAFAEASRVLIALMPGTVALGATKVLSSHLSGVGKVHLSTISSAANLVVNIAANLLLIPRVGVVGAGIASTISYSVSFVIMLAGVSRDTGTGIPTLLHVRGADVSLAWRTGADIWRKARALLRKKG